MATERADGRPLATVVTEALDRWARDQAGLIALLVEFDRSGEWAFDNSWSCAEWVAKRTDLDISTIREWLRIGHALTSLHEIRARFADRRLSYSKVRVLVRVAKPENERELCDIAERVPAAQFQEAMAKWLSKNESDDDRDDRQRGATSVSWRREGDGMVAGWFRLPTERAAVLTTAIDAQVEVTARSKNASAATKSPRRVKKWPTLRQQRADALLALVSNGGSSVTTEIVLHVRGDGCTFDDGSPIAGSIVERLAPPAFLRALIHDAEGRPINASSRQRHPTTRQKRVVKERDRRCVDCGSTDLLQYDHDPDFETSQRTVVEELQVRCAICHRARHGNEAA